MDTKEMTVGETEPVTMAWLKDTMPSPPPTGLVAVVLKVENPSIAVIDPPDVALVMDPNARKLTIKARAEGTTTITAIAVTGPAGVAVPAVVLNPLELTVKEAPETYYGRIVIGT